MNETPETYPPGTLIVVGSLNTSYQTIMNELPLAGEQVVAPSMSVLPAGRGLGEAIAAARAGSAVQMVGSIGRDTNGQLLLDALADSHTGIEFVRIVDTEPTGTTIVQTEKSGASAVTIVPGANHALRPQDVRAVLQRAEARSVVLLHRSIPMEALRTAISTANERGCLIILDISTTGPSVEGLLNQVSVLATDRSELFYLTRSLGIDATQSDRQALELSKLLKCAIVCDADTDGAYLALNGRIARVPSQGKPSSPHAAEIFVGYLGATLATERTAASGRVTFDELLRAARRAELAADLATVTSDPEKAVPSARSVDTRLATLVGGEPGL